MVMQNESGICRGLPVHIILRETTNNNYNIVKYSVVTLVFLTRELIQALFSYRQS